MRLAIGFVLYSLVAFLLTGCATTPEGHARKTITALDAFNTTAGPLIRYGVKRCVDDAITTAKKDGKEQGRAELAGCSRKREILVTAQAVAFGATDTAIPALEAAIEVKQGNYDAVLLPAINAACSFRQLLVDAKVPNVPPLPFCGSPGTTIIEESDMGNWNLSISGVGPHHNDQPYDVEKQADSLVRGLKSAGHNISEAKLEFDQPGRNINLLEEATTPATTAETEGVDA